MSNRFENLQREFPDFDVATLPAIPAHWVDISWHNDACPTFEVAKSDDGSRVYVTVDYVERADREHGQIARFMVCRDVYVSEIECETDCVESNYWPEVVAKAVELSATI